MKSREVFKHLTEDKEYRVYIEGHAYTLKRGKGSYCLRLHSPLFRGTYGDVRFVEYMYTTDGAFMGGHSSWKHCVDLEKSRHGLACIPFRLTKEHLLPECFRKKIC